VRLAAAAVVILLGACGKKESTALDVAYGAWTYRNTILGATMSGGSTLDGSIDIDASRDAGGASDWFEIALNGNALGRITGSRVSLNARFRPGANWIRFFSSAACQGWEYQVDARSGTRFAFTPKGKMDYEWSQTKDE
jgi:hypothetical protein